MISCWQLRGSKHKFLNNAFACVHLFYSTGYSFSEILRFNKDTRIFKSGQRDKRFSTFFNWYLFPIIWSIDGWNRFGCKYFKVSHFDYPPREMPEKNFIMLLIVVEFVYRQSF